MLRPKKKSKTTAKEANKLLYYPNFSLVSKSFRSLVASPDLYKTRSLLNRTESCLYVYLDFLCEPSSRWFTLVPKPNRTLAKITEKKESSSGYVLVPIPVHHSLNGSQSLVAVGSTIYAIGGFIEYTPSSSVSFLNCQFHTWHEAPSMRMKRHLPAVNVVNGKIYVAGGLELEDLDSSNWMEVFDPKTQTWESVLTPPAHLNLYMLRSAVIEGEIYMFGEKGVSYKPEEARWKSVEKMFLGGISHCVIDNILYCYRRGGGIKWFDLEKRFWTNLRGLKGLPKFVGHMMEYGGKLAVFWDKRKTIWCAVVWGKVEWLDVVLTVPRNYLFVDALTATI
ncbi:hypothetical protein CARUB_v10027605mg [Capsella rubella]|uniref:F-box domain-containing protein n=1 Tax=Capsella rubella TaxID=81985 RepID=R0GPX4_9BRAS|nr:hypothetical protein CARUB_v10027605mg [Capsella rubella]